MKTLTRIHLIRRSTRIFASLAAFAVAAFFLPAATALAQEIEWNNTPSGTWTGTQNWNPQVLPSSGTGVVIRSGTAYIEDGASVEAYHVKTGSANSNIGTVHLRDSARLYVSQNIHLGDAGKGMLTIQDTAYVSATNGIIIFAYTENAWDEGILNLQGGTLATQGFVLKNPTSGTATININGGAIQALATDEGYSGTNNFFHNIGDIAIDGSGLGAGSVGLILDVGDGVTITTTNNFTYAQNGGSSNLALKKTGDGELALTGTADFGAVGTVSVTAGVLNIRNTFLGGSLDIASSGTLMVGGAAKLWDVLDIVSSVAPDSFLFNGLTVSSIDVDGPSPSLNTVFSDMLLTDANLGAGSGIAALTVDTTLGSVSLDSTLSFVSGANGSGIALEKTGANTLTLTGDTYDFGTGQLIVSNGVLELANAKAIHAGGFVNNTGNAGALLLTSLFNGGTSIATSDTNNYFNGIGTIDLGSDGYTFDTATYAVTATNSITASSGSANFAKEGTGMLTLAGTQYDLGTGSLLINSGTLGTAATANKIAAGAVVSNGVIDAKGDLALVTNNGGITLQNAGAITSAGVFSATIAGSFDALTAANTITGTNGINIVATTAPGVERGINLQGLLTATNGGITLRADQGAITIGGGATSSGTQSYRSWIFSTDSTLTTTDAATGDIKIAMSNGWADGELRIGANARLNAAKDIVIDLPSAMVASTTIQAGAVLTAGNAINITTANNLAILGDMSAGAGGVTVNGPSSGLLTLANVISTGSQSYTARNITATGTLDPYGLKINAAQTLALGSQGALVLGKNATYGSTVTANTITLGNGSKAIFAMDGIATNASTALLNLTASTITGNSILNIRHTGELNTGIYNLVKLGASTPLPAFSAPYFNDEATARSTRHANALLLKYNATDSLIQLKAANTLGVLDLVWTGVESSAWTTTTEPLNWVDTEGFAIAFQNADRVLFNDIAPNTTVSVNDNVTVSGITVNTNTNAYTFQGAGSITGTGADVAFVKNGSTTLTIAKANVLSSFSGTIDINGGKMQLSEANALAASAAVDVASGATLGVATGAHQTINALYGDGTLGFQGANLTVLSGSFGGTLLNNTADTLTKAGGGVFTITNIAALGSGTTSIAGGVFELRNIPGYNGASKTIVLNGGWLDLSNNPFVITGTDGAGVYDWRGLNLVNNDSAGTGGVIGQNDVVHITASDYDWHVVNGTKKGVYVAVDAGNGTAKLADNSDYAGITGLVSGTLLVSKNNQIGDVALARSVQFAGGDIRIIDDVDASGRALEMVFDGRLTVDAGKETTWRTLENISGNPATFLKDGEGSLTFAEAVDYQTGTVSLAEGQTTFAATSTLANLLVADDGILAIGAGEILTITTSGSLGATIVQGADATLINLGILNATQASTEGSFENTGTATIDNIGQDLTNSGYLTVYGVVSGTSVLNTGTITGADIGIHADNAAVVVTNDGVDALIEGADKGVWFRATGTLVNAGLITGGTNGVELDAGGRVENTGTIVGQDRFGIRVAPGGGLATVENNAADALIQGGITGIVLRGGTVTNSGSIVGDTENGIYVLEAEGVVSNFANASIAGGMVGIQMSSGGTVGNEGVITGGEVGVFMATGGTITNSGSIHGLTVDGVIIQNGPGRIDNELGGEITGAQAGVEFLGTASGTVNNAGNITGTSFVGILIGGASAINNATTGIITSIDSDGVRFGGPDSIVTNEGQIIGGANGILISGSGEVINSGTITGADTGIFADSLSSAIITNTTGGMIRGFDYAINLAAAAANEVHLWNGSVADGDMYIEDTSSILTLNGDGGTYELYSTAVTGSTTFTGTLIKQGEGTWYLDRDMEMAKTDVQEGYLYVEWDTTQLNGNLLNVEGGAVAAVFSGSDTTISNELTGEGTIDLVNMYGTDAITFALSDIVGTGFSGTLGLWTGNGYLARFDFDDNAADALAGATLMLGDGSETTLTQNRTIGGLDLAGGTFIVKADPAAPVTPYTLTVENLYNSAPGSTIGVDTDILSGINPPMPPGDGLNQNVFDVDVISGTNLHGQPLVHATGSNHMTEGTAFTLIDSNGAALPDPTIVDYTNQGGTEVVGENTYGYNAVSLGSDLVLNYGLIEIKSIHATEAVILDPTGSFDKTLSSKLTGDGAGFTFTGTDTITLANGANTYSGATLITGQITLQAGVKDVIASSGQVTIDAGAAFALNNLDQKLQNVSGGGNIHLGSGTLTVANTQANLKLAGVIDGTGAVVLGTNSVWTLTNNNLYSGPTTIQTGAHLQLGDGGTAGILANTSAVANSGTLTVNRSNAVTYGGAVTGSGVFIQRGSGTTTLTGANKIDGGLIVEKGALQIGSGAADGWVSGSIAANAAVSANASLILNRSDLVTYSGVVSGSGNLAVIGTGTTVVTKVQTYTGATRIEKGTLRTDIANALAASSGVTLTNATLNLNNFAQTLKNLNGASGIIRYHTQGSADTTYNTLTITGNFGGTTTSYMNVDLVNRKSDQLVVNGTATGTHSVVLNSTNTAALNDPERTYALKIIAYQNGDAVFTSNGLESGMHTYKLHQGDGGLIMPDKNSWYLSGGDARSRAADAILFTAGVMSTDWNYEMDSVQKRLGDIRSGIGHDTGSIWARANTYRINASADLGGSRFTQDTYGMLAGGDKVFGQNGYTTAVGGFVGITHSERTFDDPRNRYGDGDSTGMSVGGYALWLYENGWYIDLTGKFDRYDNELHARGVDGFTTAGKYSSNIWGASLEIGKRIVASQYVWVEPQVQAAYAYMPGSKYNTVRNGVENIGVEIEDGNSAQYRAQVTVGANLQSPFKPYARLGISYNKSSSGDVRAESRRYSTDFEGTRYEAGLGVSYLINNYSQVYLDYEYNRADKYERPWAVNLGYRRAW